MSHTGTPRPLISAAMIVRDEAHHLGPCLDSLAAFADEVVIVDTGSIDATRDMAVASGARVFDFPWIDDFSAARNVALDHATGEWILYIDADERVFADDIDALRRDLRTPDLVAASVRFRPFTGNTAYPEFRLVRNRPDIRFEGAMHETYVPGLMRVLAAEGGRIAQAAATIQHVGYDGDQSHKLVRNQTLLLKQIERAPERIFLRWHLGTVYRDLGRTEEALEQWRIGVDLARRAAHRMPEEALCFVELARAAMKAGDDALPLMTEALALQPDDHNVQAMHAQTLLIAGRAEAALAVYRRHAGIDADTLLAPMSYEARLFGALAHAGAGACLFRLERFEEAAEAYETAARLEPGSLEFRTKAALSRRRLSRPVA